MDNLGRRTLTNATRLLDLLILVGSFGVAALPLMAAHGPMSFTEFLSLRIKIQNFVVFFLLLWVWHTIFLMLGLYNSKRMWARRAEAIDVVKATSLSALVLGRRLRSRILGVQYLPHRVKPDYHPYVPAAPAQARAQPAEHADCRHQWPGH
jgi:hypothetical protein